MADVFVTLVGIVPSAAEQLERDQERDSLGSGQMKTGLFGERQKGDVSRPRAALGTVPILPGVVLTATPGTLQNVLTYSPRAGGDSYNIYWATSSGVTKSSNKITAATTPYVHPGLTAGQRYYYAASTVTAGGEGALGPEVSSVAGAVPASASPMLGPVVYSPTYYRPGGVPTNAVPWASLDPRATSFNLYGKTAPGVTLADLLASGLVASPYPHPSAYDTTNYYRMTAVGPTGESPLSNEVSVLTGSEPPPYVQPAGIFWEFDADFLLTDTFWTDRVSGVNKIATTAANVAVQGGVNTFRSSGGTTHHPFTGSFSITPPYTIIIVDRYNGLGANGRNRNLTTPSPANWLLGRHGGNVGAYYAGGWVSNPSAGASDGWHMTVGTGQTSPSSAWKSYLDGIDTTATPAGGTVGPGAALGLGGHWTTEYSNADTALVLVWKRVLTPAEITSVFEHYRSRFGL